MARKLPQNRGARSASVGHSNRGTMLRYLLALLACLERAPGQAGPAPALPQISPMGPVRTYFPRTQRRPLEPSSPAQRFAAIRLRHTPQQHRAHHSGEDQSRFPLEGSSLSERDPALEQTLRAFRAAELALLWAQQPSNLQPAHSAQRLSFVREFARYRSAADLRSRFRSRALHRDVKFPAILFGLSALCLSHEPAD
jgi:hypothetical protein